MLVFSTALEKWRSASARGKGAKEEAALLNGKSLQELKNLKNLHNAGQN